MKQLMALMFVALTAAACGDSDSPTSPSTTTTNPNQIIFTAQLRPSNEVPPVSNAESVGSGTATLTFNVQRSGNDITSGTVTMQFSLSNFPSGTTAVAAHIHTGREGANGGVLVNTGLSAANAVTVSGGAGSFTSAAITVEAAQIQQFINDPAGFYFNVHSSLNPAGVARGQLVRQ